jgi:meso-butanediol dehydrogenase / (S,S)-butanediol dehydrogenase / diacetyl reductase
MTLVNKVIFLTGGGSGIGCECARAYAAEGAKVAIADIDGITAEESAQLVGNGSIALRCDVSNGASVDKAVETASQHFKRLDAVHNNAGITSPSKPIDETTEDEWDRLINTNLKSLYWTTRSALALLKETRGTILNTASMAGVIGQSRHAAYTATKGGMIALTKSMALDYASFGIRVNAICPAGVWTPALEQWCGEQPEPGTIRAYLDEIHALGYCPHGDVIADAAVFLLSDKARFITGCILPVSGGAELGYRR